MTCSFFYSLDDVHTSLSRQYRAFFLMWTMVLDFFHGVGFVLSFGMHKAAISTVLKSTVIF